MIQGIEPKETRLKEKMEKGTCLEREHFYLQEIPPAVGETVDEPRMMEVSFSRYPEDEGERPGS